MSVISESLSPMTMEEKRDKAESLLTEAGIILDPVGSGWFSSPNGSLVCARRLGNDPIYAIVHPGEDKVFGLWSFMGTCPFDPLTVEQKRALIEIESAVQRELAAFPPGEAPSHSEIPIHVSPP